MSPSTRTAGMVAFGGVVRWCHRALVIARLVALGLALGFAPGGLAQDEARPGDSDAVDFSALPKLLDVRVSTTPERARLVVDLSAPAQFAFVSVTEPDRIAVDVQVSEITFDAPARPAGEGLVSGYRMELAAPGRGRAVLFLGSPAQVQQAYVLEPFDDQPARLVVDLVPETAEGFAAKVAADRARSIGGGPAEMEAVSTAPGATALAGPIRPLIVIDPGHGGVDAGARARNGAYEKDLVLAFALKLQEYLVNSNRFDVALTRDADQFLKLEDRVGLARHNKADLFISVHADSFADPAIRGASIYTRDEQATDVLDKVLAEQENKADLIAGLAPPDTDAAVVGILVDLMRRDTRRQAYVAAGTLIEHLKPSIKLRRFPLRRADFFVLQAPEVPSVLVELGYLSNDSDADNLISKAWRDRVAAALARGIGAYFDGSSQR